MDGLSGGSYRRYMITSGVSSFGGRGACRVPGVRLRRHRCAGPVWALTWRLNEVRSSQSMGPSGSGKSTLLNCLAGLERPTDGRVLLEGVDVTDWDESARTRLRRDRVGFVFQAFHLVPYLTVEQNVALPVRLADQRPDRVRVARLLERFGLNDKARVLPGVLSGGQQQRVAIARALVSDPAVVLADEPTGALDSATAGEVLGLLRHCVDDLEQTVVMVTHDPVAASTADAVVFLVDGRIVGRMDRPTADAVAGQLAHLNDLVTGDVS